MPQTIEVEGRRFELADGLSDAEIDRIVTEEIIPSIRAEDAAQPSASLPPAAGVGASATAQLRPVPVGAVGGSAPASIPAQRRTLPQRALGAIVDYSSDRLEDFQKTAEMAIGGARAGVNAYETGLYDLALGTLSEPKGALNYAQDQARDVAAASMRAGVGALQTVARVGMMMPDNPTTPMNIPALSERFNERLEETKQGITEVVQSGDDAKLGIEAAGFLGETLPTLAVTPAASEGIAAATTNSALGRTVAGALIKRAGGIALTGKEKVALFADAFLQAQPINAALLAPEVIKNPTWENATTAAAWSLGFDALLLGVLPGGAALTKRAASKVANTELAQALRRAAVEDLGPTAQSVRKFFREQFAWMGNMDDGARDAMLRFFATRAEGQGYAREYAERLRTISEAEAKRLREQGIEATTESVQDELIRRIAAHGSGNVAEAARIRAGQRMAGGISPDDAAQGELSAALRSVYGQAEEQIRALRAAAKGQTPYVDPVALRTAQQTEAAARETLEQSRRALDQARAAAQPETPQWRAYVADLATAVTKAEKGVADATAAREALWAGAQRVSRQEIGGEIARLRQAQRKMMEFGSDPMTTLVRWTEEILERESDSFLARNAMKRVFYKKLTAREIGDLHRQRQRYQKAFENSGVTRNLSSILDEKDAVANRYAAALDDPNASEALIERLEQRLQQLVKREDNLRGWFKRADVDPEKAVTRYRNSVSQQKRWIEEDTAAVKDLKGQMGEDAAALREAEKELDRARRPLTDEQRARLGGAIDDVSRSAAVEGELAGRARKLEDEIRAIERELRAAEATGSKESVETLRQYLAQTRSELMDARRAQWNDLTVQLRAAREAGQPAKALYAVRRELVAETKRTHEAAIARLQRELALEQRVAGADMAKVRAIEAMIRAARKTMTAELKGMRAGVSAQRSSDLGVLRGLRQSIGGRDATRVAELSWSVENLKNVVHLWGDEVKTLERQIEGAKETLRRLQARPQFRGQKKAIQKLVENIEAAQYSIQRSYRFGGTKYTPRMYFSKELEQSQDAFAKGVGDAPRIDPNLVAEREAFSRDRRAKEAIVKEAQLERAERALAGAEPGTDEARRLKGQVDEIRGQIVRLRNDEILDPSYPVATQIQRLYNDRAATELFDALARNSDAAISRKEVEALWQIDPARAKEIERNFTHVTSARYGALQDHYVSNDVMKELSPIFDGGGASWMGKAYENLLTIWKTNKTALNPATHGRNIIGNILFLEFAGINAGAQVAEYSRALGEIANRSALYREFTRTPLGHAKFLDELSDLVKLQNPFEESLGGRLQQVGAALADPDRWARGYKGAPGVKQMIHAYNMEDEMARFMLYSRARELGFGSEAAVNYVNRYLPNYDQIPHSVVSKAFGIWQPFYKFTWSALPIMARNMIEQPVKMAKWLTMGRGMNDLSANMLGLDANDPSTEDMRALLPNYVPKGIFAPGLFPLTPKVDKYGRLQFLDASYYIPGANLISGGGDRNLAYDVARDLGVPELAAQILPIQQLDPGNPFLRAIAEVSLNKQFFNDMEIVNENAPLEIQKEKYARYVLSVMSPNILGFGKTKLEDAIGEALRPEDPHGDYYGRSPSVGQAVADVIFGVKTRAYDMEQEQERRLRETKKKMDDVRANIGRIDANAGMSPEEKASETALWEQRARELEAEIERMSQIAPPRQAQ